MLKSFEITVSKKAFYEVQLEDESIALNEVVAIGYGTQSKATVTSGIESVKAGELSSSVSASPLNNLQGKVAGSLQIFNALIKIFCNFSVVFSNSIILLSSTLTTRVLIHFIFKVRNYPYLKDFLNLSNTDSLEPLPCNLV